MARTSPWERNDFNVHIELGSSDDYNDMDSQCNYWPPSPPVYADIPEEPPATPSLPMTPEVPKEPMFVLPDQSAPPSDDLTKRYQEIVADRDAKLKVMSQMRDDFYMIRRELEATKAKNQRLSKIIDHMVRKKKAEERNHETLKQKLSHISDYLTYVVTSLDDVDTEQPHITEYLSQNQTPPQN